MEKFVKVLTTLPLFLFFISGCASAPISGYISREDHPYKLQIRGGFEKVVSSTVYALKSKGWKVVAEADPSTYEQDDHYNDNGYQNLLLMTEIKEGPHTSSHLNVFIHSLANTCEVEIRYEAISSMIKQFTSVRNDKMVEDIMNAIQLDVLGD